MWLWSVLGIADVEVGCSKRSDHSNQSCCVDGEGRNDKCARPCREQFKNLDSCFNLHCQGASLPHDCHKSCKFLDRIERNKPGTCLKQEALTEYTSACVSSCRHDGDCDAKLKCCEYGCGTKCVATYAPDQNLLPIATDVAVQERKRGRSVMIRWVQSKLREDHVTTHANLYIVQWRWGVSTNPDEMTPWQTISIRNKMYAIVKHLLSPGRYYEFRVAAVNGNGSSGFSQPSPIFRLSKSPKAPGKPENLSPGAAELENGLISQYIHWTPPISDLPIIHYEVSWAEVPEPITPTHKPKNTKLSPTGAESGNMSAIGAESMLADSPELNFHKTDLTKPDANSSREANESRSHDMMKRKDDDLQSSFHLPQRTTLVQGDKTSARLTRLRPGHRYRVEVQAVALSEADERRGEKATLYLVPSIEPETTQETSPNAPASSFEKLSPDSVQSSVNDSADLSYQPYVESKIVNVTVEKPYYQNGLLKSLIAWRYVGPEPDRTAFEVKWWPAVCLGSLFHDYSVSKPLSHNVETTSFELYDLQFGCHYTANITAKPRIAVSSVPVSARTDFETPKCQDTVVRGEFKPYCPKLPSSGPSVPIDLHCTVLESDVKYQNTGECTWAAPLSSDSPITAYRVVYGQTLRNNLGIAGAAEPFTSLDRNTVVIKVIPPDNLSLRLNQLLPDTEFIVQVQAVSKVGMGPVVHTSFTTPSMLKKSSANRHPAPSRAPYPNYVAPSPDYNSNPTPVEISSKEHPYQRSQHSVLGLPANDRAGRVADGHSRPAAPAYGSEDYYISTHRTMPSASAEGDSHIIANSAQSTMLRYGLFRPSPVNLEVGSTELNSSFLRIQLTCLQSLIQCIQRCRNSVTLFLYGVLVTVGGYILKAG